MATRLKSITAFINVAPFATVALPHGLNIDNMPVVPDELQASVGGFVVNLVGLNIVVTNGNPAPASVDVLAEHWHTIERDFGDVAILELVPQPFILTPAGAGGGNPVNVQDEGVLVGVRPTLNFIGTPVTAVDNPGMNRVDITITGTALGGPPLTVVGATNSDGVAATASHSDHQHRLQVQVQDEGVLTSSRPTLNFVGGGVTVTDDGGGDRAIITIPAGVALGGPPLTVVGATNSDGVAATSSHSDHQHRLEVQVQEEGVLVGSRPTLNFIGASITAVDNPGSDRVDITVTASGLASTMAAGTVAAPGISVVGDPNTGIYSPGADQFAIATGGVQAFLFTTQGGGFPAGVVGAPGLFVIGDTNTGLYQTAADELAVAAGGVQASIFTTQGISIPVGAVATPGLCFVGDVDTGIYRLANNRMGFTAGAVLKATAETQGLGVVASGVVGAPSIFWLGDTDTGIYPTAANELAITCGGTQAAQFTSQGVGHGLGAVGTPSIFIVGDTNTGIYSPGADQMAVAAAGTQVAIFAAQGIGTINGTAGAPSFYFSGDVDTGMHRSAANTLALDAGGASRLTVSSAGAQVHPSGAAATPSIFFQADTTTGLYLVAAGTISVTVSAGQKMAWQAQGTSWAANGGTVATPSLFILADTDTGFHQTAPNDIAICTGGAERVRVDNTAVANEISLLVSVAGAAVKRMSQNAIADSGGLGFRMVIVPN